MTLLNRINSVPPCLCRLAARKGRGAGQAPKTCAELAQAAGISPSYVAWLSRRRSWDGVRLEIASAFANACGVDLLSPWRTLEYLRRAGRRAQFKNATVEQRKMLARIMSDRNQGGTVH